MLLLLIHMLVYIISVFPIKLSAFKMEELIDGGRDRENMLRSVLGLFICAAYLRGFAYSYFF